MSAADTALQVLTWAASEEVSPGDRLPTGDLAAADELAAPPASIRGAIGRLAAVTAGRLRLTAPPLGDSRPPGLAAGVLAAAAGARTDLAAAIGALTAAPREPMAAYDLAARHAVAHHALRAGELDKDLADLLRDVSPLTAVLDHPSPIGEYEAEDLLSRLLAHRDGYDLAVRTFAVPAISPEQATWRGDVLAGFRHRYLPFVLDVYETGMELFGGEHLLRRRRAQALLSQPPDILAARPLVQWWRGLSEIERARPGEIRKRKLITSAYVDGVRTYRIFANSEAAAGIIP
jgi:hypothetical protein